jgi:hypothetical protein
MLSVSGTLKKDIPAGCVKLLSGGLLGERLGLRRQPEVSVRFHTMRAGIFQGWVVTEKYGPGKELLVTALTR